MPAFFLDELTLRTRIVTKGREVCGLGSTGDPERQRTYEEFCFPHPDDDRWQEAMADQMSSCGLVARALLFLALVDAAELGAPYHRNVGKVIEWLISIAKRMNAWVDFDTAKPEEIPDFEDGDVVVIGREGDSRYGGPTHVITLLEKLENGDWITCEGGQPEKEEDAGEDGKVEKGYGILQKCVRFERRGRETWCRTVQSNGTVTSGRRVVGFINPAYLRRTDE